MLPRFFLPAAWIFGQLSRCIATISNRTIDDTQGDPFTGFIPTYAPAGQWNLGQDCSGCFVQPDPSQVFDGSWHDTTTGDGGPQSSVTLEFTGTAIYIFCVVPNTIAFTTTVVNLQFTLDGTVIGTYAHAPDTSDAILYSVPVLSSQNLANKPHTLVAETASVNASLFIFDYAIYTFDDSTTPSQVTSSQVTTPSSTLATTLPASKTSNTPTPSQSTGSKPISTSVASAVIATASTTSAGFVNTTQIDSQSTAAPAAQSASPSSSSSRKSSTSIIAGSVAGAVVVLAALAALFLCVQRKRRLPTPMAASAGTHQRHGPELDVLLGRSPAPSAEALGRNAFPDTAPSTVPSTDAFSASALYGDSSSRVAVDSRAISSTTPSMIQLNARTIPTNTSPSMDTSSTSNFSASAPSETGVQSNGFSATAGTGFYSDRKSQLPPPYTQVDPYLVPSQRSGQ